MSLLNSPDPAVRAAVVQQDLGNVLHPIVQHKALETKQMVVTRSEGSTIVGFYGFLILFLVRVYPNRVFPVTRKTRPPLKPMRLRRADVAIPFSLQRATSPSPVATSRRRFKCRNQELNAFPMDGDPPSKVGYRRATRKYTLTSRFTAYGTPQTS